MTARFLSSNPETSSYNGDAFNFASLPTTPPFPAGVVPCDWITGQVDRINGDLHLTLILPHGPKPMPAQAFPEAIVNPADGVIALPQNEEEVADVDA